MLETCLRQSTCWWRSSLGVGGGRQRDKQCRSLVQTSSCCPTVTRTAPDNYHLKSSCRQLPSLEPLWTRQASLPHHQPTRQAATNQTPPDIYKHQTFAETKLLYQVSKNSYQVGISSNQHLVIIAKKYNKIYFFPARIPINRRSFCCQLKLTDCSCFILLLGDVGV